MAISDKLRAGTRDLHREIEASMGFLLSGELTREHYTALLARMHGFYAPLEANIHRMNPYEFVPDYSRRLKVPLLVQDLHSLGRGAGTTCLAHQGDLPDTSTPSRVLGCLYVLEGASLGGQIIRRHIEARLDLAPERGLAFFSGYGEETAAMWRQFSRYLENYAAALDQSGEDEIINGARQVFTKLGDWLNGERSEPGAGCISN